MSFVHYFVSLDARIYEPNMMDLAGFRLQRYNILRNPRDLRTDPVILLTVPAR